MSLSCPLECEYLQEAHRREKPVPNPENQLSNSDITVTEEFIRSHEELLVICAYHLVQAALRTPGAIDADVMVALEALIQTHRTRESGLYYETKAENRIASSIQRSFTESLQEYEKIRTQRERQFPIRNSEMLAILVFLYRIGQQHQNGRPRGRMFLSLLREMIPEPADVERVPSIIL